MTIGRHGKGARFAITVPGGGYRSFSGKTARHTHTDGSPDGVPMNEGPCPAERIWYAGEIGSKEVRI